MEIFNSIWAILSTPNEGLVNILAIPATLMEHLLMMSIFISISNINASRKQKITYILFMTFISLTSMNIIPSPFNIIINYFIMIIISYLIFKISFFKSLILIVISAILVNLVSSLILNPFLTIWKITSEQLITVPIYRLLYITTLYCILFIIIIILKTRNLKMNLLDTIDKKSTKVIVFNLFLGIFSIAVQSITLFYYVDKLPIFITFLSFISFLAYFILSIYSLTRAFKLTLTTQKLESAEEYNNTLRILHDNVRGFKHDFDNIVTTIGGYIKTNDMEGLKKYYSQLEDDCQRVNNLYI